MTRCLSIAVVVFVPLLLQPMFAADTKMKRTVETEVVRLTRAGFEPARIMRSSGSFRLFVQSTAFFSSYTLVLENESKAPVKTKKVGQAPRQRWVEDHNLASGTYVLRVLERPELSLQIVIR